MTKLASQLEEDGRVAEAIQHYHEALTVDPDNPVILNNLARILATADKPELCNGEEAVQLATKAVVLTDARHVVFFETLAAAHARAGQFSEAIKVTSITRYLALLTDRHYVDADWFHPDCRINRPVEKPKPIETTNYGIFTLPVMRWMPHRQIF